MVVNLNGSLGFYLLSPPILVLLWLLSESPLRGELCTAPCLPTGALSFGARFVLWRSIKCGHSSAASLSCLFVLVLFEYATLGRPPFIGFLMRTAMGLWISLFRSYLFWFALGHLVRIF